MTGTAVESLPGGILDRLVDAGHDPWAADGQGPRPGDGDGRRTPEGYDPRLAAARAAAAAGAYAEALRELAPLAAAELAPLAAAELAPLAGAEAAVLAWRCFAWYGCWLGLPDGVNRPWNSLGDKMAELPRSPSPSAGSTVEERTVGRLIPRLRDWRCTIAPQLRRFLPSTSEAELGRAMIDAIDEVRAAATGRPDLLGHLDLLAADAAARVGDHESAEASLRSARTRLAEADDRRGLGAAALVTGDLLAAPLTSPLSWNCVLDIPTGCNDALVDDLEAAEFDGSAAGTAGVADVAAAAAAYDDAERWYAAASDPIGQAAVALRRGYLCVLGGRPRAAADHAGRARLAFDAAARPLDAAVAAVHEALATLADDRFPEATELIERLVSAAQTTVGHSPVVGMGVMCVRMGRYWAGRGGQPERAQAAFRLAERLWAGLGEPVLRMRAIADIGEVAQTIGDLDVAQIATLEALDVDPAPLAKPVDPVDPRLICRITLATQAYTLATTAGDAAGMERAGRILSELSEAVRAGLRGHEGPGLELANHLLALLAETGRRRVVELACGALAAQDAGDCERSRALFAAGHEALRRNGAARDDRHDLDEAVLLAYEGHAVAASNAFERYCARHLPAVPADGGGPERLVPVQLARTIHDLGLSFQLGVDNAKRARAHRDALAATGDPWWFGCGPRWRYLALDGRLMELERHRSQALDTLDAAIGEIEHIRATLRYDGVKTSFFGGQQVQSVYLSAARVALRLAEHARGRGHAVAAARHSTSGFEYAERAQSRALLDLMSANSGIDRAGLPADLVSRWRSASAAVSLAQSRLAHASLRDGAASPQDGCVPAGDDAVAPRDGCVPSERAGRRARLDEVVAHLDDVESELRRANPRFWNAINPQVGCYDAASIAAALPAGTTLLQYAVGRTDLLCWAVTSAGVVAEHRLTGRHGVPGLVASVVGGCSGRGAYEEPARELAGLLLEPLRAAIGSSTSLLVVPGGCTTALPFEALPFDGVPLGEALPVTVLPNAGVLCAAWRPASATVTPREPAGRGGPRRRGRPLVIGDPAGMSYAANPGLPPQAARALPGARVEAAGVARLLPGAHLLIGDAASKQQVTRMLAHASVVHFATHGVLEPQSSLGSAVLLADGEDLTVAELLGVRMEADLVVLSACHTGAAGAAGGAELLGFGRALLAAGAGAAVVTRWAVDDLSATLLMNEFYRRRLSGEPDHVALRSARRYLRGLDRVGAIAAYGRLRADVADVADDVTASRVERAARDLEDDGGDPTPYAHPYHWAPYVLIRS